MRYNPATQELRLPEKHEITVLLQQWRDRVPGAEDQLFSLVLPDLRRLAHYLMAGERRDHSVQPTALVNEIYLRLVNARDRNWESRRHFFAVASRAMRQYLIDVGRRRNLVEFVTIEGFDESAFAKYSQVDLALTIDALLKKLETEQPDWCTIVEMKFFLAFTDEEAAEALGMTVRTFQRKWMDARMWLFEQMESGRAAQSAGR
ncbi:MAG: RNA polymerase subunit sigma-70 [Bryobacterales bacterium]|nr:RNA polymerase subunit sigma-70 [Bryobacterales bacterium]